MKTFPEGVTLYRQFRLFTSGQFRTFALYKVDVNGRKEYFATSLSEDETESTILPIKDSYFGIEPANQNAAILSEAETDESFYKKVIEFFAPLSYEKANDFMEELLKMKEEGV